MKLVAVADCYNGRLEHSKEIWGDDIFTTRDYNEILARKDIDAVIIGTPDHWHKQASVDAMKAGKDVYCEKPMIHLYSDGPEMIETARQTNRIIQIGSQRVSSMIYAQGEGAAGLGRHRQAQHGDRVVGPQFFHGRVELHRSSRRFALKPAIGRVFSAPRRRFPSMPSTSSSGASGRLTAAAWRAICLCTFSAARISSPDRTGPRARMATGGLRFWKDGRDAPDVMLGLFDYRKDST